VKYTINSINQLGISEYGLSDKTDLTDWVMLDYIFDWQQNPKALSLNGMVWFSYRHFMNEMPIIGIKDKGAISKRVKKLKELDLISTYIDTETSRIFVRTTEKYFDVTRFKTVDLKQPPLTEINTPVDLKQPPVDLKQPNSITSNSNTNNSFTKEPEKQIGDDDDLSIAQLMEFKPAQLSSSIWESTLKARKKRDAVQTKRAINGFIRELEGCEKSGVSMEQALDVYLQKKWKGINADWMPQKSLGDRTSQNQGYSKTNSGNSTASKVINGNFSDKDYGESVIRLPGFTG
jgi:hypothetical protein